MPQWKRDPPCFSGIRDTPVPFSRERAEVLRAEVQSLLDKAAIEMVPKGQQEDGFYSTYFLVTKKDGGFRPILNLKGLNKFIEVPSFRMETLRSVISSVETGDWLTSIDLKDAYLHVPIHSEFKKYLRFSFDGKCYQFRVLPFGISTAPRVFTKLMLIPAQLARSQGRCCHPYLDDWLLRALGLLLSHDATQQVMDILLKLGWIINLKKSDLTPTQVSRVPQSHSKNLASFAGHYGGYSGRGLACEVEDATHSTGISPVVVPFGELRDYSRDSRLVDSSPAVVDGSRKSVQGDPLRDIDTFPLDSDGRLPHRLGGVLGELSVSGRWAEDEVTLHIFVLELRAVRRVFESFVESVRGQVVRLEMDNQTALTYILKQGGTVSPSLLQEAWQFLTWCDQFDIRVLPVYLPGIDNVRADALSRRILAPHEWMLHRGIFGIISQLFGSFQVDLFASGATNQIHVFCSRILDPRAIANDAFLLDWTDRVLWAFPPVPLISRVLSQLTAQPARLLVLLAPLWSAQSWFPVILRFLAQPPVLLPFRADLLSQNGAPHPNPRIQWVAWPLSGVTSMREEFLHQLQTQFWRHGGIRRTFNMRIDAPVMRAGVSTGGFSIPFLQI
ncbi:uncharacterized protein [Haliotis asinina]|uniref:uncharacterized protein n=1 Tax=Haliotis asinina TaxID=109174 RepID=UPI0035323A2C